MLKEAVREDRAPGGRPRIKSLIGMKENADTFVSSELITQLIQARPDATPKRRPDYLELGFADIYPFKPRRNRYGAGPTGSRLDSGLGL